MTERKKLPFGIDETAITALTDDVMQMMAQADLNITVKRIPFELMLVRLDDMNNHLPADEQFGESDHGIVLATTAAARIPLSVKLNEDADSLREIPFDVIEPGIQYDGSIAYLQNTHVLENQSVKAGHLNTPDFPFKSALHMEIPLLKPGITPGAFLITPEYGLIATVETPADILKSLQDARHQAAEDLLTVFSEDPQPDPGMPE